MWSDREAELDLLNVQHLVAAVETTVTTDHMLPVTVGVFGDWGSGKSTVIRLTQANLANREDVLCVHFNGWLFEGYEDAKAAILGTILDELADERGAKEKAADLFGKLLRRVDWLRVAGWGGKAIMLAHGVPPIDLGTAGTLLQNVPDAIEDVTKKAPEGQANVRRTIRDFEKDFAQLLEKTGVRSVVVFIDDLDRCLPSTIIETLEAIRLFVFVPGMAFVIAADERLVRRAVRQHFPDIDTPPEVAPNYPSRDVGREYLEKLIQVPVHVPPLARPEIATYVNLLFAQRTLEPEAFSACCERVRAKLAGSIGADVVFSLTTAADFIGSPPTGELADDLALAAQLGDVLSASVDGNPRQTKRFLNALVLRLKMAEARGVVLERRVTAKLMLLEYFRPTLFRALAIWQATQHGEPGQVPQLEEWNRQHGAGKIERRQAEHKDSPKQQTEAAGAEISAELQQWISDGWVRSWLALEPSLGGMNLAPYFFFARERSGLVGQLIAELSPAAAEVVQQLLVSAESSHMAAARASKDLTPVEASSVFDALVRHTTTGEGLEREHSALAGLLRFVVERPEFKGQLLAHVRTLPIASIGAWAPPLLARAVPDDEHRASLDEVIERWHAQEGLLGKAAGMALKRLRKGA